MIRLKKTMVKMMTNRLTVCLLACCLCLGMGGFWPVSALASDVHAARIGTTTYASLGAAVEAANAMDVGADEMVEIVVLQDLDLEEKLTISKNMTISGEHTINRTKNYKGQMFSVPQGVKLILKDLTFEGNHNWTADMEKLKNGITSMRPVYIGGYEGVVTEKTDAPKGDGTVLVGVGGHVVFDGVTFQNFMNSPIYWVGSAGKLELNGATIDHNARPSGGVLGGVDGGGYLIINKDTVISDNFCGYGNGALGTIYGNAIINGGDIYGNVGMDCNGYIFMIIYDGSYCEMNGGSIHDNFCTYGGTNGWNCAFYVYGNGATFKMNGGSISSNYGSTNTGIANNGTNASVEFHGGSVVNNYSNAVTAGTDFNAYCNVKITDTVDISSSRFYGNLENKSTLNGNVWFYRYATTYSGGGTINGKVTMTLGTKTTFASGKWNGVVTVRGDNGSTLTVKNDASITGGPVRVLAAVASADSQNAAEASAAQAAAYVEESGASVDVPVLYYHRLTSEQKKNIVVTFDYNGGLDAENWSGIQRTSSEASYVLEPLPEPVKDGYQLAGWVLAANPGAESMDYSGSAPYVSGTPVTESCRYIARWKREGDGAETYQAVFQYDGTVPAGAPQVPPMKEYAEGETVVLPILMMDGYVFAWDTSVLNNGKMPATDIAIIGTWVPVDVNQTSSVPPASGDSANVTLWMVLCLMSGLAGMALLGKKSRT